MKKQTPIRDIAGKTAAVYSARVRALLISPVCLLPLHAHAGDPALAGPFTAAKETLSIPASVSGTLRTDVFFPRNASGGVDAAAKPCPVIVLGHGFSQSKSQHTNQGSHFATRGYIALVPNFSGSDHSRNANDISKCLDWIVARNADTASPYFGAVRTTRMGATGHSAGGMSALVAASRDARIRAVAPMDPVDSSSLGVNALASVTVPVAITYSEPSACNSNGSAAVLYAAAPRHKRGMKIAGANHTDPQDPAGALSILTCGAASAARQTLYRRAVTGWFEYYLKADATAAPWVFNLPGGQIAADLSDRKITYAESPPASPFAEWQGIYFAAATPPLGDPDGDLLPNAAEYALALDPLTVSDPPAGSLVTAAAGQHLAITFTRATMATDATVTVQVSSDLVSWTSGSSYAAASTPNTAATTEVAHSGSGIETITVRDNTPPGATHRYMRLHISLP